MRFYWGAPIFHLSGANTYGLQVVRGLNERGHDARFLLSGVGEPPTLEIPCDCLPQRPSTPWPERWELLRDWLAERAPCVWVPNYDFLNFAVVSALPAQVRVIGVCHADESVYYRNLHWVAPYLDAAVGVSSYLGRQLTRRLPPERVRTIFTTTRLQPARSDFNHDAPLRLIYTGRLETRQKRSMDLVGIARELDRADVPFTLTIVGSGPLRERIGAGLAAAGLDARVTFKENLPPQAVPPLYREADVFVLPSAYEGLSVSLLEAMAAGCAPVITHTRSGADDVIRDGVNGCLCPVGDCRGFARRIAALHKDRARLAAMGRAAQESIPGRFDCDSISGRWHELVESLAELPPAARTGWIRPHPDLGWRHQALSRIENRIDRIREAAGAWKGGHVR